jgi:Domain of unknown function (DUF3427)
MVSELSALAGQLGRRPTLVEYLAETRYDLSDVYKSSVGGWYALLDDARLLAMPLTEADRQLARRFERILHMDSTSRLRLYLGMLRKPGTTDRPTSQLEKRMVQMLSFRLLQQDAQQPGSEWNAGLIRLEQSPVATEEFEELCGALLDTLKLHIQEEPVIEESPLFLHRQYTRDEVLVGLGLPEFVGKRHTQTGRFWIEELNTEVFFVTLDKSDKAFSPTTRYEDFAVSPTRFHWQSQSTTDEDSRIGQRYVRQSENGAKFLLFVRPRKTDAFVFLGPLQYVTHSGSRPMSIYWDLAHPMPAWFFEICASLRVA